MDFTGTIARLLINFSSFGLALLARASHETCRLICYGKQSACQLAGQSGWFEVNWKPSTSCIVVPLTNCHDLERRLRDRSDRLILATVSVLSRISQTWAEATIVADFVSTPFVLSLDGNSQSVFGIVRRNALVDTNTK